MHLGQDPQGCVHSLILLRILGSLRFRYQTHALWCPELPLSLCSTLSQQEGSSHSVNTCPLPCVAGTGALA